jgi:thiosulfate/3-mercaptopyruvate sulfurtransferase
VSRPNAHEHKRFRFFDCRYDLADPGAGRRLYLEGHVPGAVHLDLETDLSGSSGSGGRHPLPTAEEFAATASRAGIGEGVFAVAYGNGAARLWWLLRHFGHDDAAVIGEWHGPHRSGEERPEPAAFVTHERTDDLIGAEELAASLTELVVVDARAPERWRGEREPIDPIAGRIPGALNWPAGTEQPPLPEGELVAYCGSGVAACELVLEADRPARLYAGSWSDWITHDLPIEKG